MIKTRIKDLTKGDYVEYRVKYSNALSMARVDHIVTDMTHHRDIARVKTFDGKEGILTDNDSWLYVGGKVDESFCGDKVSNKKLNKGKQTSDVQQKKRFEHLKGNLSRMERLHNDVPKSKGIRWINKNTLVTDEGENITIPNYVFEDPDIDLSRYVNERLFGKVEAKRGKVKLIDSNTVEFENGMQMKVIVNIGKTHPTSVHWLDDTTLGFDNGSRVIVPEEYKTKSVNDIINKPNHYTYGDIETIDFVEQVTSAYPTNIAFSIGNAIKYIARAPFKNGVEDLKKAVWYLDRAIKKWEK